MGGWFLDRILVFLIRSILRFIREIRSHRWSRTEAIVDGAYAPQGEYFPYASLAYLYSVGGAEHAGRYERAFFTEWAASDFANQYADGVKIVIRFRSRQPDRSYFSEDDQAVANPVTVAR